MTSGLSLKLSVGIALVLTATLSTRAVAVEQARTSILIPNIQEPEEMRVAPFPMHNTVPTAADRALEEKIQVGQAKMRDLSLYEATLDFTDAIKMEGRELLKSKAYEGRADAYMQTYEWKLAIKDLTTAISLEVGSSVLVGNISQFRAIYPEYAAASDESIAQKLNQTFYPEMKYEDFSQRFLTGHSLFSTTISDLYIKRSDAYLKKGDWRSALIDFRRATNGFPDYAAGLDRWRKFEETSNTYSSVDMENFDDAHDGLVKLSIKQAHRGNDVPGPYELYRFELNCSAEKIRALSWAEYDASGTLKKSGEGGRWGSIWPATLGKILEDGACRNAPVSTVAGYLAGCLDNPAHNPRFADIGYYASFAPLCDCYQCHLHINLDERCRNRGIGSALIAAFAAQAASAGRSGIHVVTGERARNVRFYEKNKFRPLATARWNGADVVFMGRLFRLA